MRILHTMIRVADLERSIDFYTKILGMRLVSRSENSAYRYTLAFVGYNDKDGPTIELTYNWDTEEYTMGNAFGHIALGVEDIYKTVEDIRVAGATISREPGPVLGGTTEIAFVRDPDGYSIELIEQRAAQ